MELIQAPATEPRSNARFIVDSRQVGWDIDDGVIRGRRFDSDKFFLPNGLSKVNDLEFLVHEEQRFLSQIQGRSYANMLGVVEQSFRAGEKETGRGYAPGEPLVPGSLVKSDTGHLNHQALFQRLDKLAGEEMPEGYRFLPQPDEVGRAVLGKSRWAVLGLTLHIDLYPHAHYRESIEPDNDLSELWKDVLLFHWKEESQHAVVDEREWIGEDQKLTPAQRDRAVAEFIELVGAVDGILQLQAKQDSGYFIANCARAFSSKESALIGESLLRAYRWQHIVSGFQVSRFRKVLASLITPAQGRRIVSALVPIL